MVAYIRSNTSNAKWHYAFLDDKAVLRTFCRSASIDNAVVTHSVKTDERPRDICLQCRRKV